MRYQEDVGEDSMGLNVDLDIDMIYVAPEYCIDSYNKTEIKEAWLDPCDTQVIILFET